MGDILRIAVLDMNAGVENEGMRCIRESIENFATGQDHRVCYQVFDVRQQNEVPDLNFDGFISSGGPGNPHLTGEQWERRFFYFLDKLSAYNSDRKNRIKKPLFLICHSFQLACIHWKIGLVGRRRSGAFGIFPVHKTRDGQVDPLLEGLGDPFWIVDSRDFQVIQPNAQVLQRMGARILCLEKIRPHVDLERAVMAIRFSREIIGTQFHPEADATGMARLLAREDRKEKVIRSYGEEKYQTMVRHLEDPDKIVRTEQTILPRFLLSVKAATSPNDYASAIPKSI
jgi:homoserine O-succinyltransferase